LADDRHKIQIILATYKNAFEVLNSFDLGASKSGIHFTIVGQKFITTTEGLYALTHRVNKIDPSKYSTHYITRLIKYMERGYAIEFTDLNPTSFQKKVGKRIKMPYMSLDLERIQDNVMVGALVIDHEIEYSSIGYDNLDYKTCKSDISYFIKYGRLIARVNEGEFQTGAEAIAKSCLPHTMTPIEVVNYLPSIYNEGKLDVELCATIKDFDFNEFLKCHRNPDLLNSYLTAVYYYPKSVEYTVNYHKAYSDFCKIVIPSYDRSLFGAMPKTHYEFYGAYKI
jgi:hypothetical protein